jgi:hypothetical protein
VLNQLNVPGRQPIGSLWRWCEPECLSQWNSQSPATICGLFSSKSS